MLKAVLIRKNSSLVKEYYYIEELSRHEINGIERVVTGYGWTTDPVEALKFADRESAELFAAGHISTGPQLDAATPLLGFVEWTFEGPGWGDRTD